MTDGNSAIIHINRLKRAYSQVENKSAVSLSNKIRERLKGFKAVVPEENNEIIVEKYITIPSGLLTESTEGCESDDSDENAIGSAQRRVEDPEWSPGSLYLQRKLHSSKNTAYDIAYRLRSRLVSRSEREA